MVAKGRWLAAKPLKGVKMGQELVAITKPNNDRKPVWTSQSFTQPENWSPAFFAAVAARAAIRNENWQRAQEFVNLGLEFDPKAKELGYLNLILVRQQIPR